MGNGDDQIGTADRGKEERRRLKTRNWVLFAVLLAFVVVIYFVSIVRMGAHAA